MQEISLTQAQITAFINLALNIPCVSAIVDARAQLEGLDTCLIDVDIIIRLLV